MKRKTFKKPFGDITLEYEVNERNCMIYKVIVKEINILSKPIKNTYCRYNEIEYMGFQIYDNDYIKFCELTGINRKEDHAFISFDNETAKEIKKEINQLELQVRFKKQIEQAKLTGENIYYNSELIPCNDNNEECNWDYLRYTITPNGEINIERIHTW